MRGEQQIPRCRRRWRITFNGTGGVEGQTGNDPNGTKRRWRCQLLAQGWLTVAVIPVEREQQEGAEGEGGWTYGSTGGGNGRNSIKRD